MQDCNGKRFGALVTTIPLLMLAIVMLGAPSASALVPFRGFPANHHSSFGPAFLGSPTDTSLLPFHGLSVNYHTDSTPALKSHYGYNSNSHVTEAISFVGFKHIGKTLSQPSNKESRNNRSYRSKRKWKCLRYQCECHVCRSKCGIGRPMDTRC